MHYEGENKYKVKQSHFPVSIFLITFFVLLVMAGIHYIIIEVLHIFNINNFFKKIIVISYWMIVAGGFTLFTRWQMRKNYEKPMKQMAKVARLVAIAYRTIEMMNGTLSVESELGNGSIFTVRFPVIDLNRDKESVEEV